LVKIASTKSEKSQFEKITEEDVSPKAKRIYDMDDGFEIKQKKVSKGTKKKAENKIVQWLPEEAEELQDQLNEIMIKVDQYANVTETKTHDKVIEAPVSALDEDELKIIRTEYRKAYHKTEAIDYEKLDSYISKLSFFSQLPDKLRKKVLRCSAYSYFPAGTVIHRRIDREDQIYILLRGSIAIKTLKNESQEKKTVAILSPGAHFGEYSHQPTEETQQIRLPYKVCTQMGAIDLETGMERDISDQKRSYQEQILLHRKRVSSEFINFVAESTVLDATPSNEKEAKELLLFKEEDSAPPALTVEVAQTCEVICIQRDKLDSLLQDPSEKELNAKIKLLINLNIFKTIDQFGLIPLAKNIVSNMYAMGEVVISIGKEIDRFRIIAQGRCKIIKRRVRLADSNEIDRYQQRKRIPKIPKRRHRRAKSETTREVEEEKYEVRNGKLYVIEHELYGILGIGDAFGGRALLTEEDGIDDDFRTKYVGPAKFSVVADSPCVEILELDKEHADLVPQFLMKPLKKSFMDSKEFDEELKESDSLDLPPEQEA